MGFTHIKFVFVKRKYFAIAKVVNKNYFGRALLEKYIFFNDRKQFTSRV